MIRVIGLRFAGFLQTLVLASILAFAVLRVVPGDPARLIAGPLATPATLRAITNDLGLDKPLVVQYVDYVVGFVRGDWGFSYSSGEQVRSVLADRLPATLELATAAFLLAVVGALVFAVIASYRPGPVAGGVKLFSLIGLGTPPFWLALVLLILLSSTLGLFPGPSGRLSSFLTPPPTVTGFLTVDALLAGDFVALSDALAHLALPAVSLAVLPWAFLTRLLTSNLQDKQSMPFTIVVRSTGVSAWTTHWRHVLHNAALPTVASSGLVFASLITGSVFVEQIFAWPGIGQTIVQAVQQQDFAVVQTFVLISAVVYLIANLVVDVVSGVLDPRLRVTGGAR